MKMKALLLLVCAAVAALLATACSTWSVKTPLLEWNATLEQIVPVTTNAPSALLIKMPD